MTIATYLIVEPNQIIATDLALSIQDCDTSGHVVVAATPADALVVLRDATSVRFAFIHADPAGFDQSGLGVALRARGAVCVFMGDAADCARKTMIVLDRPFSPGTIAALMHNLAQSDAA